jgi:hypothetical protein
MTQKERNQLKYLQNRKNQIIDNMIYACMEINEQIKEVKSGEWLKNIEKGDK